MKPFNLEQAKKGHPVCTRDGRDARIICYDAKIGEFPIIALVYFAKSSSEAAISYTSEGKYDTAFGENDYDLMMKPICHTGWVNIHSIHKDSIHTETIVGRDIYPTKEEALKAIEYPNTVIDTIKIEWKE